MTLPEGSRRTLLGRVAEAQTRRLLVMPVPRDEAIAELAPWCEHVFPQGITEEGPRLAVLLLPWTDPVPRAASSRTWERVWEIEVPPRVVRVWLFWLPDSAMGGDEHLGRTVRSDGWVLEDGARAAYGALAYRLTYPEDGGFIVPGGAIDYALPPSRVRVAPVEEPEEFTVVAPIARDLRIGVQALDRALQLESNNVDRGAEIDMARAFTQDTIERVALLEEWGTDRTPGSDWISDLIRELEGAGLHDEEWCDGPQDLVAEVRNLIEIASPWIRRADADEWMIESERLGWRRWEARAVNGSTLLPVDRGRTRIAAETAARRRVRRWETGRDRHLRSLAEVDRIVEARPAMGPL